jgi:hypothetical protein
MSARPSWTVILTDNGMWCIHADIYVAAMRERLPREIERRRAEKKARRAALAAEKAARASKRRAKP